MISPLESPCVLPPGAVAFDAWVQARDAVLDAVVQGGSRVIVTGPSGIGKSILLLDVARRLEAVGWSATRHGAPDSDSDFPVAPCVRHALLLDEADRLGAAALQRLAGRADSMVLAGLNLAGSTLPGSSVVALQPMAVAESEAYLDLWRGRNGAAGLVWSDEARGLAVQHADGVPRLLARLLRSAEWCAQTGLCSRVTGDHVEEAVGLFGFGSSPDRVVGVPNLSAVGGPVPIAGPVLRRPTVSASPVAFQPIPFPDAAAGASAAVLLRPGGVFSAAAEPNLAPELVEVAPGQAADGHSVREPDADVEAEAADPLAVGTDVPPEAPLPALVLAEPAPTLITFAAVQVPALQDVPLHRGPIAARVSARRTARQFGAKSWAGLAAAVVLAAGGTALVWSEVAVSGVVPAERAYAGRVGGKGGAGALDDGAAAASKPVSAVSGRFASLLPVNEVRGTVSAAGLVLSDTSLPAASTIGRLADGGVPTLEAAPADSGPGGITSAPASVAGREAQAPVLPVDVSAPSSSRQAAETADAARSGTDAAEALAVRPAPHVGATTAAVPPAVVSVAEPSPIRGSPPAEAATPLPPARTEAAEAPAAQPAPHAETPAVAELPAAASVPEPSLTSLSITASSPAMAPAPSPPARVDAAEARAIQPTLQPASHAEAPAVEALAVEAPAVEPPAGLEPSAATVASESARERSSAAGSTPAMASPVPRDAVDAPAAQPTQQTAPQPEAPIAPEAAAAAVVPDGAAERSPAAGSMPATETVPSPPQIPAPAVPRAEPVTADAVPAPMPELPPALPPPPEPTSGEFTSVPPAAGAPSDLPAGETPAKPLAAEPARSAPASPLSEHGEPTPMPPLSQPPPAPTSSEFEREPSAGDNAAAPTQPAAPAAASPAQRPVVAAPLAPPVAGPPATPVPAARSGSAVAPKPENPAATAFMIQRGRALLAVGDVSGARLMLDRAARGGSAEAALEMGRTYDPAFIDRSHVRMAPDAAAALQWYRRAATLGSGEAEALATQLQRRNTR